MKSLKKTGLSVSLFVFSLLAHAGETRKTMIVELDGNERVTYSLSETPTYWQSGNMLHVYSASTQSDFELASVSYVHFSNVSYTDVEELRDGQVALYPNPVLDWLIVSGVEASASIGLTNSEGVLLHNFISDGEGEFRLEVGTLPTGVYFLNINNKSFKFVKK